MLPLLLACAGADHLQETNDSAREDDRAAGLTLDIYPTDAGDEGLVAQSFELDRLEDLSLHVDTPITLTGELTGFQANPRAISVPGASAPLAAEIAAEVPGTPMGARLVTEDGSFSLRLLPGQAYEVAFLPEADAEVPILVEHGASFARDGELDVHIDYGVPLYGLVSDADGDPMAGVEVRLVDPESGFAGQAVTSDADGAWSLRALEGDWQVELDGGTARPWLPTRALEASVGPDTEELRRDMAYGVSAPLRASGRVVGADGDPLADVKVRLTALSLEDGASLVAETESDGNGSFAAQVVAGRYRVELVPRYLGEEGPRRLPEIREIDGDEDLGIVALAERPVAVGVVSSPDGQPLDGAVVAAKELGFDGYVYEARTDATGTFTLPAAEGELRWTLYPPDGVQAALTHAELAVEDVGQLQLVVGERASGCVTSDAGVLAWTPVDLRSGEDVLATTTTDEEGCFEVRIDRGA